MMKPRFKVQPSQLEDSRSIRAAFRGVCRWLFPLLGERVGVRGNRALNLGASMSWYRRTGSPFIVLSFSLLVGLWSLEAGIWTARAASTNTPASLDYSSFKIITDRNIFNAKRSSIYKPPTPGATIPAARIESFALLGTMSYEKGPFAFFDGTSSDYRKVIKADDTIAGFKVVDVQPAYVKLTSGTNQMLLLVGKQLQRENGGPWQIADRAERAEAPQFSSDRGRPRRDSRRAPEVASEPGPPGPGTDGPPPGVIFDAAAEA